MPPNEDAMELLRTGDGLQPPRKPQFLRDFAVRNPYASQSKDTVNIGQASSGGSNMEPGQEELTTATVAEEERSTTPSDSPPSPPSPRLSRLDIDTAMLESDAESIVQNSPLIRDDMDLDDDIPVWDPEVEAESRSGHAAPTTPLPARSDIDLIMDLDDDILVWDPEEDDGSPLTRQASQSSSSDGTRAYQEHLNGLLRKHTSQQAKQSNTSKSTPASTVEPFLTSFPFKCTAEEARRDAVRIRKRMHRHLRKKEEAGEMQIHPDATGRGAWTGPSGQPVNMEPPEAQKEEGSDKALLEALFLSIS